MTYRARTSCPVCNYEEEVWIQNGNVCFNDIVVCAKCENMFDPMNFISHFMDLRSNVTVSSKSLDQKIINKSS